jgi:hypothetical protein
MPLITHASYTWPSSTRTQKPTTCLPSWPLTCSHTGLVLSSLPKKVWVISFHIAYSHVPTQNYRSPFLTLARRPAPPLPKFSELRRWSTWGCWQCIFIYYTLTILEEPEAHVQAPTWACPDSSKWCAVEGKNRSRFLSESQLDGLDHYQQPAIGEWPLPYAVVMLLGLPRDESPKFSTAKR